MRRVVPLTLASLGLAGCIVSGSDPCEDAAQEVYATHVFDGVVTQGYLITPPAAGECHAVFTSRLAYTGDDAFDPTLPQPAVDVSANAVGTGGEQPGLLGILTTWRPVEDPDSGERSWWSEFDAGAKNIDAPSVSYGLAAVRLPAETLTVEVYLQIDYRPPPSDEPAARLALAAPCRR